MNVIFRSRDTGADRLRELAVSRVQFALRRMSWLVPRADVQLSDVNGPRGGVDKRCQVRLTTERTGTIVISATARDWRSALDSALARATRALLRLWRRGQPRRAPDLARQAPDAQA